MKHIKTTLVSGVAASLLLGCTTIAEHKDIRAETRASRMGAEAVFANVKPSLPAVSRESAGFWVNKRAMEVRKDQTIPISFNQEIQLNVGPRSSLRDLSVLVSRIRPDVKFTFAPNISSETLAPLHENNFNFQGSLTEALNTITGRSDVFWKVLDNPADPVHRVYIYKTDIATFQVMQPPGNIKFESQIGAKNSTSGAQSASTVGVSGATGQQSQSSADSSHSLKISGGQEGNFWKSLQDDLTPILTPGLGKLVVSENKASVTVTDTPPVLATVRSMIDKINDMNRRQVTLNITVLSVQGTRGAKFGLDWEVFYRSLSDKYSLSLAGGAGSAAGLGALTSMVIDPNGRWDNTKAIIGALGEQGEVSLKTEVSLNTKNNMAAQFNSIRERSYTCDVTSTATVNAGVSASAIACKLVTGLSALVTPQIIDGRTLHVNAVFDLSFLDNMRQATVNGITVERPDVSRRSFNEGIELKSGQTLILGGLQQVNSDAQNSGTLGSENLALGGSLASRSDRATLIVIITPYITSNKRG